MRNPFFITINKGYKCFVKNDIAFNFDGDLAVITGVNGCGKTNLLQYIAEKYNRESPGSVFFKTTTQSSTTLHKRIMTPYGPSFLENLDITTVSDIVRKIANKYVRFTPSEYTTQHDFIRCLFDENSLEYQNNRERFLQSVVLEIMVKEFDPKIEDEFNQKFGFPTSTEIEKELRQAIEYEVKQERNISRLTSKKKESVDSEVTQRVKYSLAEKLHDAQYKRCYDAIRNKKKSLSCEIDSLDKLQTYIYQKINPFKTMEGIISKLSSIIAEDERVKISKKEGKTKILQQINHILDGKKSDGTDILMNETQDTNFSDKIQKMFRYKLKNPNPHDPNYELYFSNKADSDNKRLIHFDELSSGEKIIFELICYVYIFRDDKDSYNPDILLLDEFDANLNPALASIYLKIVKEFLIKEAKLKVILTTHSPSTVAEVDPPDLWEMINEEEHCLKQANTEDAKGQILAKLAPKFFYDNGFIRLTKGPEDTIIFTEGDKDANFFDKYAKEQKYNYKLYHAPVQAP